MEFTTAVSARKLIFKRSLSATQSSQEIIFQEAEPHLLNDIGWFFSLDHLYVFFWPMAQWKNVQLMKHPFFKRCFQLPHFPQLWKTIQKGSFAYNSFLFRITPLHPREFRSRLADLTCLAILFGDEFLDGICQEAGKSIVCQLVQQQNKTYCLEIIEDGKKRVSLQYAFDLYKILPSYVWELKNEKYGITYRDFYELLKELLCLINEHLLPLELQSALPVAGKIKEACDWCFDTFRHDVLESPVQLDSCEVGELLHFHDSKNRCVQKLLLELRCRLLNKKLHEFSPFFEGWMSIISIMQIYDDLQDVFKDESYQDNLLLFIARNNFSQEYDWFQKNRSTNFPEDSLPWHLSVNMPRSVNKCLQLALQKMLPHMNLTQLKICNYLWCRNWYKAVSGNPVGKDHKQLINYVRTKTKSICQSNTSNNEWKSYTLDTCFHHKGLKKFIYEKLGWKDGYLLKYCFVYLSSRQKAAILDRVMR